MLICHDSIDLLTNHKLTKCVQQHIYMYIPWTMHYDRVSSITEPDLEVFRLFNQTGSAFNSTASGHFSSITEQDDATVQSK